MDPDLIIFRQILQDVIPAVVMIVIGTPLAIAIGRRIAAGSKKPDRDALQAVETRLARIESAVDAIAIEVERVAESQRYVAKLQSGQGQQRVASNE